MQNLVVIFLYIMSFYHRLNTHASFLRPKVHTQHPHWLRWQSHLLDVVVVASITPDVARYITEPSCLDTSILNALVMEVLVRVRVSLKIDVSIHELRPVL